MQSAKAVADKLGVSGRRVCQLCSQGRVVGAVKVGKTWILPDDILVVAASRSGGRPKIKM